MTGEDVFDTAIKLMNEQRDSDGESDTTDTVDYKNRSLAILNTLLIKAFPYSDEFLDATSEASPGRKPLVTPITSLSDTLPVDDAVGGILCYGLAARLSEIDMPEFARDMQSEFESSLVMLSRSRPALSEDIVDFYGANEYYGGNEWGEFSRWK